MPAWSQESDLNRNKNNHNILLQIVISDLDEATDPRSLITLPANIQLNLNQPTKIS